MPKRIVSLETWIEGLHYYNIDGRVLAVDIWTDVLLVRLVRPMQDTPRGTKTGRLKIEVASKKRINDTNSWAPYVFSASDAINKTDKFKRLRVEIPSTQYEIAGYPILSALSKLVRDHLAEIPIHEVLEEANIPTRSERLEEIVQMPNARLRCELCRVEFKDNPEERRKHQRLHQIYLKHLRLTKDFLTDYETTEQWRKRGTLEQKLIADYSAFCYTLGYDADKCLGLNIENYMRFRLGSDESRRALGVNWPEEKLTEAKLLPFWPNGNRSVSWSQWNDIIIEAYTSGRKVKAPKTVWRDIKK